MQTTAGLRSPKWHFWRARGHCLICKYTAIRANACTTEALVGWWTASRKKQYLKGRVIRRGEAQQRLT